MSTEFRRTQPAPTPATARDTFARRAILISGVAILIIGIALFLWYTINVFLLVFAGILLAILLRIPTRWLHNKARLPEPLALALVLLLVVAAMGLAGWFIAPTANQQIADLLAVLPNSIEQIRQYFDRFFATHEIFDQLPPLGPMVPSTGDILSRISGVFTGIFGAIASLLIVLFIGLYLSFQPHLYINGLVQLVPPAYRQRASEVLNELGEALKWWLIGRLFAMVVLGVFVGIGLWLLNVPYALALAILTGILSFVPILGSIAAAIAPLLVALLQSPTLFLYVLLLYLAAQAIESYLLTPMVQQRAVEMPPVLAFIVQLLLGILAGPLGVALAYPIAIAGRVLVKMLYLEDVLGSPS